MSADIKRITSELPKCDPIPIAVQLAKAATVAGEHGQAFLILEQDRARQQNDWIMKKMTELIDNQETLSDNQIALWNQVGKLKSTKNFIKGAVAATVAMSGFVTWLVNILKG